MWDPDLACNTRITDLHSALLRSTATGATEGKQQIERARLNAPNGGCVLRAQAVGLSAGLRSGGLPRLLNAPQRLLLQEPHGLRVRSRLLRRALLWHAQQNLPTRPSKFCTADPPPAPEHDR